VYALSYERSNRLNIRTIVASALNDAQAIPDLGTSKKGLMHRERSKNFVECLSERLLEQCDGDGDIASLSKHHDSNRNRFGMNELLFDVAVIEYKTVDSGASGKDLSIVTRGIWAVESELAKDKREALFDFNKLVLAASDKKLFVGPRVKDEQDYLRVLGAAAQHCIGEIFVALIPHPEEWPDKGPESVVAWEWKSGEWCPVG
jgi:hypothetical protein